MVIAFERHTVGTGDVTHDIYLGPENGPGVLLLHELAGLTDNTLELADEISAAGFTVAVPHLFGRVGGEGTPAMLAGFAGLLGRCIAREMTFFVFNQPQRGAQWLSEAAGWLSERSASPRGVGVIGMCAHRVVRPRGDLRRQRRRRRRQPGRHPLPAPCDLGSAGRGRPTPGGRDESHGAAVPP